MNDESVPYPLFPVKPDHRSTPDAYRVRTLRAANRMTWTRRPKSEDYERAAAIFLRLALLVRCPVTKRSPLHARQIRDGEVNPSTLFSVTRELYGEDFRGMEGHQPARSMMTSLGHDAGTTGFPHMNLRELLRAHKICHTIARSFAREESGAKFQRAANSARSAIRNFFKALA